MENKQRENRKADLLFPLTLHPDALFTRHPKIRYLCKPDMKYTLYALLIAVSMFLGMVLLLEVGRRIGARRLAKDPEGARVGLGALEAGVFGLLGLLIAFTFSGAASRFDARRQMVIQETNNIGTAYLRLDLLPTEAQAPLREHFRRYVDARISIYEKLPDIDAAKAELVKANNLQREIWRQALAAARAPGAPTAAMAQLLPAINAMIDITTTQTWATQMHPPAIIFVMLYALALAGSLLAGSAMAASKSRSLLHMIGYPFVLAVAVYVIIDIEFPRLGFIRVDAFDQALVELRQSMNEAK